MNSCVALVARAILPMGSHELNPRLGAYETRGGGLQANGRLDERRQSSHNKTGVGFVQSAALVRYDPAEGLEAALRGASE